jgi:hypothetical protein
MDENIHQYTAFRGQMGLFESMVMLFGIVNAPATFQRLINAIIDEIAAITPAALSATLSMKERASEEAIKST